MRNAVPSHASCLEQSGLSFPLAPGSMAGHHQWNEAHAPVSGLTSFLALASLGTYLPVATNT